MPINIFEAAPKRAGQFSDDVVGRFRIGDVINDKPRSLSEFRVTTGDPDLADKLYDLLGGDAPKSRETDQEDNLDLYTASNSVDVIFEGPKAIRSQLALRAQGGKPIYISDGLTIDYPPEREGEADPDASLPLDKRKQRSKDGIGPKPEVDLYFRLADEPDWGVFRLRSGSWVLAQDLARDEIAEQLAASDGPRNATISLERVTTNAGFTFSKLNVVLK
jgi:hypothetical protein